MTSGWDIATALGTVGATVIAAGSGWIGLRLYWNEKAKRVEDRDRYAREIEAAEQAQARRFSAWSEPGERYSFVVVKNDSDGPIGHCVVIVRTAADDLPAYRFRGPFAQTNLDFGLINPGEEKRIEVDNVDAIGDTLKRSVFVAFADSQGRYWLYDRRRVLSRIGPNGEISDGVSEELDRWYQASVEYYASKREAEASRPDAEVSLQ